MRLVKLKLCNYRCFGPEEQEITINDLTTFIGNNSAGKTAALAALNCLFSENNNDRLLQRSDFHLPKNTSPEAMETQNLYIETVFEFNELSTGENGGGYSVPPFFQHLVVDGPGGVPYLRIRLEATWEKSNTIEGSIDSQISYITSPETTEKQDEKRCSAYRRDLDKIRVVYVPAVRDPSKQLKNASGTMMYQIMSSINWSEETKGNVKTKIQELNAQFEGERGVSIFGESIAKQWKTYDSDARYSTASLRFNSTDIETSIRKTEVVFEPTVTGKEYTIDQMGDGLRSLFYISLVDSILDVERQMQEEIESDPEHTSFSRKPPILTIVALEEPENHIAPHLLGKLVENLKNIAKKKNSQAIMTSHSPAIVKRIDPEVLRYFRLDKDEQVTKVRKITLPEKESKANQYKYIKEAVKSYPELYFAKLVVLGEGDSEELILPRFWEAVNGNADVSGITILPLGGRHVNHFWRLLNDLHIPHVTLLDLDREREGGAWGRIAYVLKQLVANGFDQATVTGGMTDDQLSAMSEWPLTDLSLLQAWLDYLEKYNVFFSSPLDMDFLMLECFGEIYKRTLNEKEGPRIQVVTEGKTEHILISEIENKMLSHPEYEDRIKKDTKLTLKERGGNGSTYNVEQQKLMVWYNYFFLNRGKPSTHISALSMMEDEVMKKHIPPVLERLFDAAEKLLEGDNNETCST